MLIVVVRCCVSCVGVGCLLIVAHFMCVGCFSLLVVRPCLLFVVVGRRGLLVFVVCCTCALWFGVYCCLLFVVVFVFCLSIVDVLWFVCCCY